MQLLSNPWPLRCAKCDHHWTGKLPLPMTLTMFAKRLARSRCPVCDAASDRVFVTLPLRQDNRDDAADADADGRDRG